MWRGWVTAAVVALTMVGCGGDAESAAEEKPVKVRLTVLGDSLVDNTDACGGCTGFAELFRSALAERLVTDAEYEPVQAMGVPEAVEAVSTPGVSADSIAGSDVVVVQTGFNNALPDPETGIGCTTWFLETEPTCLTEGVATYGELYDEVFQGIKALRGDEPTVYVVLNTIDGNIAPAEDFPDGLLALYEGAEREKAKAWAVAAYDRWNTMLAERAEAAGFQYVDLYHEFNGPDGTASYYPELSDDGAHPNEKGHDLIASKLSEIDLSAISGK